MPAGKVHFDQTFNKNVETYRSELSIRIPVKQAPGRSIWPSRRRVAPIGHLLSADGARLSRERRGAAAPPTRDAGRRPRSTQQPSDMPLVRARDQRRLRAVAAAKAAAFSRSSGLYFVAGVVLSLLPCSYPMIPILSAIIIGEGARVTRSRGFALSVAYVFGMALVYTALGVAAALVGQSLGAWLQNPWVLGAFGVLLAVFALTLIAGVDIALPAALAETASTRRRRDARAASSRRSP